MTAKTEGQETWRQGNLNMVADHQVLFRLKVDKPKDKEVRSRFPITKVNEDWRSRNLKRVTKTGSLLLLTMKSDQGFRQWRRLKTEGQETWTRLPTTKSDLDWRWISPRRKKSDHGFRPRKLMKTEDWCYRPGSLIKPEGKESWTRLPTTKSDLDWRGTSLRRKKSDEGFLSRRLAKTEGRVTWTG